MHWKLAKRSCKSKSGFEKIILCLAIYRSKNVIAEIPSDAGDNAEYNEYACKHQSDRQSDDVC